MILHLRFPKTKQKRQYHFLQRANMNNTTSSLLHFGILWAKYHYTVEPLTCNIVLTRIDPSDTNNKKIFEKRLDFPEIPAISSTCEMVFKETKKIFGNLQTIVDICSDYECYEFKMIALNPDSANIELDCTIRINHDIFFSFKAPFDSQFSDVISKCENHFLKILNAIQQSPEKIVADYFNS